MIIEVGCPNKFVIKSKRDYLDFIKTNNGLVNLYVSVYQFKYMKNQNTPDYDTAIINKMFFDTDSKNALNVIKKFVEYFDKHNIKYYLKQSSYMRFHIYPSVKIDSTLQYKKNALKEAMIYICKQVGVTYGQGSDYDVDSSTFGDLARICPIAGTLKPKKKCYCSYISKEDLYNKEKLKERAKYGNGKLIYYNTKCINLKPFDKAPKYNTDIEFTEDNFDCKFDDKIINSFSPFIKRILLDYNGYGNWQNRFIFTIVCRDYGLSRNQTDKIAEKYFSKVINNGCLNGKGTNYDHYKKWKILEKVYDEPGRYALSKNSVYKFKQDGYEITNEDVNFFLLLYL